ncbi:NAD(P)H-dependent FMN reductase LOT6 [Cladobotryum mycophilum]|uniref:NAD(P)H-dependent FMN reductase LOT6 n=1 Tax=Cladobotryum mycophilum TaxID=491253 RepID=A0ABR0SAL9_9HYPO
MAQKAIAVVICSTRPNRINPFVAKHVLDVFEAVAQTGESPKVELIDLADQNLPLYDEPEVPGDLPEDDPTPHYVHAYTRAWSTLVKRYDAFVFVTPQYNWSIPASLKNALDYLFFEWRGKPAGIVTYGNRGGVKAAPHLRQILTGLRMGQVAEPTVALRSLMGPLAEIETTMKEGWRKEGEGMRALWLCLGT